MTEKYCFTAGNEGQASLNILEKSFKEKELAFIPMNTFRGVWLEKR